MNRDTTGTLKELHQACNKYILDALEAIRSDISINTSSRVSHLSNKATIGLILKGFFVESITFAGPAYECGLLHSGDKIVGVDGKKIYDENDLHKALKGSDIPGSTVRLTVQKYNNNAAQAQACEIDVLLTKVETFLIADICEQFIALAELKEHLRQTDQVGTSIVQKIIHLVTDRLKTDCERLSQIVGKMRSMQSIVIRNLEALEISLGALMKQTAAIEQVNRRMPERNERSRPSPPNESSAELTRHNDNTSNNFIQFKVANRRYPEHLNGEIENRDLLAFSEPAQKETVIFKRTSEASNTISDKVLCTTESPIILYATDLLYTIIACVNELRTYSKELAKEQEEWELKSHPLSEHIQFCNGMVQSPKDMLMKDYERGMQDKRTLEHGFGFETSSTERSNDSPQFLEVTCSSQHNDSLQKMDYQTLLAGLEQQKLEISSLHERIGNMVPKEELQAAEQDARESLREVDRLIQYLEQRFGFLDSIVTAETSEISNISSSKKLNVLSSSKQDLSCKSGALLSGSDRIAQDPHQLCSSTTTEEMEKAALIEDTDEIVDFSSAPALPDTCRTIWFRRLTWLIAIFFLVTAAILFLSCGVQHGKHVNVIV